MADNKNDQDQVTNSHHHHASMGSSLWFIATCEDEGHKKAMFTSALFSRHDLKDDVCIMYA